MAQRLAMSGGNRNQSVVNSFCVDIRTTNTTLFCDFLWRLWLLHRHQHLIDASKYESQYEGGYWTLLQLLWLNHTAVLRRRIWRVNEHEWPIARHQWGFCLWDRSPCEKAIGKVHPIRRWRRWVMVVNFLELYLTCQGRSTQFHIDWTWLGERLCYSLLPVLVSFVNGHANSIRERRKHNWTIVLKRMGYIVKIYGVI